MQALIVDDERDIGYLICGILRQLDMRCKVMHTLETARDLIKHQSFDLYFIDIKLPDGSGFDLVSELNERDNNGEVVIISAFDGEEERDKAKSLGVKKFINKPFTKTEIIAAIN
jgi:DNA-binding response OmpR family regulator